jgi:preprotein translocase subunit YajC
MGLLIILVVFAAMWFFTIRPQQQRLKAQRALVLSLAAGDEVVTVGGLIGTIRVVQDREVTLEIGNGIEVRVARSAVSARLSPQAPPPELPGPLNG